MSSKEKTLHGTFVAECKKGENEYQDASQYKVHEGNPLAIHVFTELHNKPLGYNTLCDLDRLLHTLRKIATGLTKNFHSSEVPLIAVGAKHGNPCGASFGDTKKEVLEKMIAGDRRAIFGGFIITSFEIGLEEAECILEYRMDEGKKRMINAIAAPSFTAPAIEYLTKYSKCLLLINEGLGTTAICAVSTEERFRQVEGGVLYQSPYTFILDCDRLSTTNVLTDSQKSNLILAWGVGSTSNSNTVTIVADNILIGNGIGQQDRVGSCELAVKKARDAGHGALLKGATAYSDSFFPFTDGPEVLLQAGIQVILASSGSVKDDSVIEHCTNAYITLCLIPDREGRGFFGH